MQNEYNSLTNQLIRSGILSDNGTEIKKDADNNVQDFANFFEVNTSIDTDSGYSNNSDSNTDNSSRKRLNRFEYETDNTKTKNKNKATNPLSRKENFLIKFFPKLYKAYIAKCALKEFTSLDIDTKELMDKTIPYGESESRYKNLIKYLKFANSLKTKIEDKFN